MSNCIVDVYRIVNTITERNNIPCLERQNGMRVTVIGADFSYIEYMMKGGDACVNSNWAQISNESNLIARIGHVTSEGPVTDPITNTDLNTSFPGALEGFRVTFLNIKTTFTKITGGRWVESSNILNTLT